MTDDGTPSTQDKLRAAAANTGNNVIRLLLIECADQLDVAQAQVQHFSELADRRHDALFLAHRQRDELAFKLSNIQKDRDELLTDMKDRLGLSPPEETT